MKSAYVQLKVKICISDEVYTSYRRYVSSFLINITFGYFWYGFIFFSLDNIYNPCIMFNLSSSASDELLY